MKETTHTWAERGLPIWSWDDVIVPFKSLPMSSLPIWSNLPCYHHKQERIDFNTDNTNCSIRVYFLMGWDGWIYVERMAEHCLEWGCIWLYNVNPLQPKDFPRPSRCPWEHLWGLRKYLGRQGCTQHITSLGSVRIHCTLSSPEFLAQSLTHPQSFQIRLNLEVAYHLKLRQNVKAMSNLGKCWSSVWIGGTLFLCIYFNLWLSEIYLLVHPFKF